MRQIRLSITARTRTRFALGAVALLLAACIDGPRSVLGVDDPQPEGPRGLVVSEPHSVPMTMAGASLTLDNGSGSVAFVSLAPGTLPEAINVSIRNVTAGGASLGPVTIFDGGFDPVPVPASSGDVLELRALEAGGTTSSLSIAVPVRRPPVIVRTKPPRGRTDVALSVMPEMVFSEPVDPLSLEGSVRLERAGAVVSATVRLLPGAPFVVQLEPAAPLDAGTAYELVVTTGVRDLDGDALAEGTRVAFSTAGNGGAFTLAQISAGEQHTCAIATDGRAYCWGSNWHGELGTGGPTGFWSNTGTPKPVAGGLTFAQVSVGGRHISPRTCGVTTAGSVYCWGRPEIAFWVNEEVADWPAPAAVGSGLSFSQVSVGDHTSAVGTDGVAYCWASCGFPGVHADQDYGGLVSSEPIAYAGDLRFTQESAGRGHSCGLTAHGEAYCWGENYWGQFGDGTIGNVAPLFPRPVGGDLRFSQVTAGGGHTCGITISGDAYCWGFNEVGQLGDGTTDQRLTPTPVAGGLRFAQLSASSWHTCGVTTDNIAYCWGSNRSTGLGTWVPEGQLGDGTTTRRLTPTPVAGGLRFAQVSAGWYHTCGLTPDNIAYCWGANPAGQLGIGTPAPSWHVNENRLVPTRVVSP